MAKRGEQTGRRLNRTRRDEIKENDNSNWIQVYSTILENIRKKLSRLNISCGINGRKGYRTDELTFIKPDLTSGH